MSIKTRFAPSPTGYLHIGGVRTALFSWLYAKKHGGQFVLRIEDTDRERSTEASVQAILQGMEWLELDWDEGPIYQTARFDRYAEVIDQLLAQGDAYYCYCSRERLDALREEQMKNKQKPRYDGCCRSREGAAPEGVKPVVRFKNPTDGEVVIDDQVKGRIVISNSELDDLIIARSDGTPTYNLTVVIDDWDMGITHVIRGDDHINNTPRQINILRALNAPLPVYAHAAMILGADGARLSKRHGAVSVLQYRDEGYLPQAVLNYLVRLGWSHGDQEIFSRAEMIELFDTADVNNAPSTFNPEKLLWLNQQTIKTAPAETIATHLMPFLLERDANTEGGPDLARVIDAHRERSKTLIEMADACAFFYKDISEYAPKAAKKAFKAGSDVILSALHERYSILENWTAVAIHEVIDAVCAEHDVGMGKVGMPLRVAVAGCGQSPAIDLTLELLGKSTTLQRIEQAITHIKSLPAAE